MYTLKVIVYVKQTMFAVSNNNNCCEHSVFSNMKGAPRWFFVFFIAEYTTTLFFFLEAQNKITPVGIKWGRYYPFFLALLFLTA